MDDKIIIEWSWAKKKKECNCFWKQRNDEETKRQSMFESSSTEYMKDLEAPNHHNDKKPNRGSGEGRKIINIIRLVDA